MSGILDAPVLSAVQAVFSTFGITCVLKKSNLNYDPLTDQDAPDPDSETQAIRCSPPLRWKEAEIAARLAAGGKQILKTDLKLIIENGAATTLEPIVEAEICVIKGKTFKIIEALPVYATEDVVIYILQLRK